MKRLNPATWLAMLIVSFVMPVIAFNLVNRFYFEQLAINELQKLKNSADSIARQLMHAVDNRKFWCYELNRECALSGNATEMEAAIKKLAELHQEKLSWVIWNGSDKVTARNINSRHPAWIWEKTASILRKCSKTWFLDLPAAEDTFIRSVLGPHVQTKTFHRATFASNPDLNELSFFSPSGSFWADFKDNFGAIVFLPPGIENRYHGLRSFIKESGYADYQLGIMQNDLFFSNSSLLTNKRMNEMKAFFSSHLSEAGQQENLIFTGRFIGSNIFFYLARQQSTRYSSARNTMLFAMLTALFLLLAMGEMQHAGQKRGISISYTVIGLITWSNIFPMLLLGLLSQQYLEQKREVLIEERRVAAVNFLHRIEGEFIAETHKIKNFAIRHIQKLGEKLKNEPLSIENTREFRKVMAGVAGKFMVVASTTFPAVSDVAFLSREESGLLDNANPGKIEMLTYDNTNRLQLNETLSKCGAAFISFYNGTSLSDQVLTEVELIIEALFQDKLHATFHRFLRLLEQVDNLGLGTEKHPTFMHFLSFNPARLADYLFMFHFNIGVHARNFLAAKQAIIQGNPHGIKVVYSLDSNMKNIATGNFSDQKQFRQMFAGLGTMPRQSAEFANLDGESWLYTGFSSKKIADISLIALTPLAEIEHTLDNEKIQILAVMLINIFLVAGITLIFVQTLLKPVNLLQAGTEAIKDRNFAWRIPELGKDEFGKMSRIFNSALVDLQEMSLARDVQQQLFPRQQFETGEYDIFCKTITMADLGGDYLDVFPINADKFIMVLGDVAGHGVGAAMIMAMAKSAMLNSTDLLDKPSALLNRLHDLIYRTKTKKQKKIMTFQCVLVDLRLHQIIYANAGGCSPFVVRASSRTVEEITLKGVALGSFKNSSFSQTEIVLEPGDKMVFYTDGLIESRNDAGEEVGFARFGTMLSENLCSDSQQYYDKIMQANRLWRQNQPHQDDLSLMVLGRRSH
ncbi:MAG TPA: SpoIIE family protein phosphatase [Candidatus Rifleibacterium sp.]|nr:SpoIIE family protein phosphatase [Candidatus Rifleibacterium sp.]HPT45135.1 SpoIIE family protein phosphatase [Candidatus Rifleibacterium sp.]